MARPFHIVGIGWLIRLGGSVVAFAPTSTVRLLAARRSFRLRDNARSRGLICTTAVIPPDASCATEEASDPFLTLFVDAATSFGRRLLEMTDAQAPDAAGWIRAAGTLIGDDVWSLFESGRWSDAVDRIRHATGLPSLARSDPEVQLVSKTIRERPDRTMHVTTLAGRIGVSADKLSERFVRDVGVTARGYIEWARLQALAKRLAAGQLPKRGKEELLLQTMFAMWKDDVGTDWLIAPGERC